MRVERGGALVAVAVWAALAGLGGRAHGAMYREAGAKQRLSQLANEHQALLSSPLPE